MAGLSNRGMGAGDVLRHFPWLSYSTAAIPENWDDIIRWARYFFIQNGDYAQAMYMVLAYFVTSLEFGDLDDQEEESYRKFFEDDLQWKMHLILAGLDAVCYGEVAISPYIPIRRFMRCPECGFEEPYDRADVRWDGSKFLRRSEPCKNPACRAKGGELIRVDRKDRDMSKVRFVRWNPEYVDVAYNPVSSRREISLRIPNTLKRDIQNGVPVVMRDIPWEFVECVQQNRDLVFEEDAIFYRAQEHISGLIENGRGLPKSVTNFRLFWHIQTLRRQDEAIAIDFITGPRIWSPAPQGTGQVAQAVMNDPVLNRGGQDFTRFVDNMLRQQREDPTRHYTAPHPLQYQFAGGEGKALSPYEIINQLKEELLHSSGVPVEFYRLNLQSQGAPMMLRLFEVMWAFIPAFMNQLLQFEIDTLVQNYNTAETTLRLRPPHIADDLERKQALLQLMAGQQVSPATALEPFGIENIRDEIKKVFEHQLIMAEEQAYFDEELQKKIEEGTLKQMVMSPASPSMQMQQQQMAAMGAMGGAPPGGAPPGAPPGGAPIGSPGTMGDGSMTEMDQVATQEAERLLGMAYEQRRTEMTNIKKTNPALHAMIKQKIEDIRQQAQSEGGYQVIQQQYGALTAA